MKDARAFGLEKNPCWLPKDIHLETSTVVRPTHPPTALSNLDSSLGRPRSEALRARAARRGGAKGTQGQAGRRALHPARGRHRLASPLTALRPLRTGVAIDGRWHSSATRRVWAAALPRHPPPPPPATSTAHGSLACSPPPPRVPAPPHAARKRLSAGGSTFRFGPRRGALDPRKSKSILHIGV